MQIVTIGNVQCGGDSPLLLIAGPCQIEGLDHALSCAESLAKMAADAGMGFVYKSSYDKANRTSAGAERGVGMDEGLDVLAKVKAQIGVPVLSDVHLPDQCAAAAEVLDIIQIPAFLCRQTDMLIEAGKTGKIVNIKKAQFLNAEKMQFAVDKVKSTGNDQVWLTERGTLFGPSELVVDFRNIQKLAALTDHVVMDCTHSAQETQSNDGTTGGNRAYVPYFAKTAKLWGANAFFLETHPNPDQGLSDGPNMLKLADLENLVKDLL